MNDIPTSGTETISGLPMFAVSDPEAIAREKAELKALEGSGMLRRWRWYFSKTGPGFLQSAFTLGCGTAIASLYIGTHYQYRLLWVQPLAMIIGIIMLMAASYQTLSTGIRPYEAMRRFLHPSLALIWAIGTLIATFVWHLPQYALAAGVSEDMIAAVTGWEPAGMPRTVLLLGMGLFFLVISTAITWSYGRGRRGIKLYERVLKSLVFMIIISFGIVFIRSALAGKIAWGSLLRGFLPLYIPTDPEGVTEVIAAFSAAVGINMTFLFGYTLLARGWGKEHHGLSRFDLVTGMFIPYAIITSLIVIAAGCTIYGTEFASMDIKPAQTGLLIGATGVGTLVGRIIFGFGIIGMALSTISLHMLVSGFAVCEMLGVEPVGWNYRLGCLIPAPAFLGVVLWQYMGTWIALPTSAFCLLLLPIPYVAWFVLHNSSRYLGREKPSGRTALVWNVLMLVSIVITCTSVVFLIYQKWAPLMELFGRLLS